MTAVLGAAEVERFRALLAGRLGLHFDETKLGFLADILRRRLDAVRAPAGAYLDRLSAQGNSREEIGALAKDLTVPETYFFRHLDQFRALVETALPDRLRARAAARSLHLLSAGCASGEEAYSLAILIREELPAAATWEVAIRGVDINPATIDKARRGRYSAWSLRETPPGLQERWFSPHGGDFALDDRVRAMVVFEERNLIEEDASFWRPAAYDVIFCRNVLMYFTPDQAAGLAARLAGALAPGGYLFLGHAETLRGLSHDFHLRHTHGTFYYQRKADLVDRAVVPAPAPAAGAWLPGISPAAVPPSRAAAGFPAAGSPAAGPGVPDVEATESWVEAVRRAAQRIRHLTESRSGAGAPPHPGGGAAGPAIPRWDLGRAVELIRDERFAEALVFVGSLPPESAVDPDVLLLRAVLLTHGGDLIEAEAACAALLAVDDLNAGAHYLLAICREGLGDRQGAGEHDQVAVYLDPGFAMPRLHLGLLARRAGKREAARRDLGQALALLQREDASRVLLFGGGFSREALVSLCRAEIVASGGTP